MANEIPADHPQVVIQRRIGIRIGCRAESRQEEGRYTPFRLQVQPPVAEFYRLMVISPDKLKHLFRIVRKSIRSLRLLPQPLLQDAIVNWIGRDGEPPSAVTALVMRVQTVMDFRKTINQFAILIMDFFRNNAVGHHDFD